MKGDQRNTALKVMLVRCPCHQNDPVFILSPINQLHFFPKSLFVLYLEHL